MATTMTSIRLNTELAGEAVNSDYADFEVISGHRKVQLEIW